MRRSIATAGGLVMSACAGGQVRQWAAQPADTWAATEGVRDGDVVVTGFTGPGQVITVRISCAADGQPTFDVRTVTT